MVRNIIKLLLFVRLSISRRVRLAPASFIFGRGVDIHRSVSLTFKKNSNVYFGREVMVRAGCIFGLSKGARLSLMDNVEVRAYTIFECGCKIAIGDRSVVGAYNWFQGSGEIEVGRDVMLGPKVCIVSSSHSIDNSGVPFVDQPLLLGKVEIGNNVWIGANTTILKDVVIGDNVVVGAGSLVNQSLEPNAIYAGTPAKLIRKL